MLGRGLEDILLDAEDDDEESGGAVAPARLVADSCSDVRGEGAVLQDAEEDDEALRDAGGEEGEGKISGARGPSGG